MATSINSVVLLGNITRDPDVRTTQTGKTVASVSLALNSSRKVNDEWVEDTTFVEVSAWEQSAKKLAEAGRGAQVFVQGKLKQDTWDDKTTGQKRSKLSVLADKVVVVTGGKQADVVPSGDDIELDTKIDLSQIPF